MDGGIYVVAEVHNYGGFFGGDTVTLTAAPWGSGAPRELTLDEAALAGLRDRHAVVAGLVLALQFDGERVARAELLAAPDCAALRAARPEAMPAGPLDGPLVLSWRCAGCGLWLIGAPGGACRICGEQP